MLDNGHPEEALIYFETAVSVNPYSVEAIFQLGKTQLRLHQPQAALPWIDRLKQLHQTELADEFQQLIDSPAKS